MPISADAPPEWWRLFAYSEWLDQQGCITPEEDDDPRTHEQLVDEFLAQHETDE